MSRPRISLAGLMASVFFVAIGIAALRNSTETWAGVMLPATLGLLATSTLGIAYRTDGRRAWRLGFALFGWGYAALASSPWSKPGSLATHEFLGDLYERISPCRVVAMDSLALSSHVQAGEFMLLETDLPSNAAPQVNASDQIVRIGSLHLRSFRAIGHCLFAPLAGLVGGFTARWFHATREAAGQGSR